MLKRRYCRPNLRRVAEFKMSKYKATVTISLELHDGETEEAAGNRLYDLLYEGVVQVADTSCDFWVEEAQVDD